MPSMFSLTRSSGWFSKSPGKKSCDEVCRTSSNASQSSGNAPLLLTSEGRYSKFSSAGKDMTRKLTTQSHQSGRSASKDSRDSKDMGRSSSRKGTIQRQGIESTGEYHDKYFLGSKIGKGGFGQVYVAMKAKLDEHSNRIYPEETNHRAVKIVDLRHARGNAQDPLVRITENEKNVWAKVNEHPNCVRLHEVFTCNGLCFMVMEKCDQHLLSHLESMGDDLNEKALAAIFAQMLTGIAYVHSHGVLHRDIKPDNFLVGGEDGSTIKLGDFGLAKAIGTGKTTGEAGTAPFMCPEMVAGSPYDDKADIWSFAVIVYVLLFGRFPYAPEKKSSKAMKLAILHEHTSPSFGSETVLSSSCLAFVMKLLRRETEMRPSAKGAMRLSFIQNVVKERHDNQTYWPSLRPVLTLACNCHAFENRNLKQDDLDDALERLQVQKLGLSLSETSKVTNIDTKQAFRSLGRCGGDNIDVGAQKSNHWCTKNSVDSARSNMKSTKSKDSEYDRTTVCFTNDGSWTCEV